jgi:hypothetical protein
MLCDIARNLKPEDLARVQALERSLGLTILAFSCRTLEPQREARLRQLSAELGLTPVVEPAEADEEQILRIRETEELLGVSLVAVRG